METIYLTIDQAVEVHKRTVKISGGGSTEPLDLGRLEGVLENIKNDDWYPEFEDKLTHLFFCTNKFHCFSDGNKRLSIVLTAHMMTLNGYMYCVGRFYSEMENISVFVAEGKIDKELLHEIICAIILEEFDSEELKLKIYNAIS
ncbi:MAG: Fic family protein [Pyrinomonadaceae bacterium]|nr:Fic family protein [Pyrinomonadaceae bacterium]